MLRERSGNEKLRRLKPGCPVRMLCGRLDSERSASVRKPGELGTVKSLRLLLAPLEPPEQGSNPNTRRGDFEPPVTLTLRSCGGMAPNLGLHAGECDYNCKRHRSPSMLTPWPSHPRKQAETAG